MLAVLLFLFFCFVDLLAALLGSDDFVLVHILDLRHPTLGEAVGVQGLFFQHELLIARDLAQRAQVVRHGLEIRFFLFNDFVLKGAAFRRNRWGGVLLGNGEFEIAARSVDLVPSLRFSFRLGFGLFFLLLGSERLRLAPPRGLLQRRLLGRLSLVLRRAFGRRACGGFRQCYLGNRVFLSCF